MRRFHAQTLQPDQLSTNGATAHPAASQWLSGQRNSGSPNNGTVAPANRNIHHTLAIGLLDSGLGLVEIGKVLRHESALATAIYAKVDYRRLAELARPWPESR